MASREHVVCFLYHFSTKNALARALLVRYMEGEDSLLDDVFARGRELNRRFVLGWRVRFRTLLAEIFEHYDPSDDVDPDALADMVSTVIEEGLVLGRATGERAILPNQLMLLRSYIKLLFESRERGIGSSSG